MTTQHPVTEEWLKEHQICWDPTWSGRARYTHSPTGRAVVRADYMTDMQWKAAVMEFGEQQSKEVKPK